MVLLVTTPTIVAALQDLSASVRDELKLPQTPPEIGEPISHEQIISLARAFTSETASRNTSAIVTADHKATSSVTPSSYTLNSLLRGTQVYIPPAPPKPEPSPEYLALKARLQAIAEEQAYNQLISPSSSSTRDNSRYRPSAVFHSPTEELLNAEETADNDPLTPSLVINIFMSVLLCGFATFWALKNFQTPSFFTLGGGRGGKPTQAAPSKEPVFVLISLFVGLVVGVAEVVVYAAYLRKVRQAKAKEKGIKERKEIISSSSDGISERKNGDDGDVGMKEEIWGKGVNGGVRRRVRERWEGRKEEEEEEEGGDT